MAEEKSIRLNKVLREFNISLDRAVEFLKDHGHEVDARPTTKISNEEYEVLFEEFETDKSKKMESKEVGEEKRKEKEEFRLERERELEEKHKKEEASKVIKGEVKLDGPKQVGKIDLDARKAKKEEPKVEEKPVEVKVVVKEVEKVKQPQKEEKAEIPEAEAEESKIEKPEEKPIVPIKEEKAEKPAEKIIETPVVKEEVKEETPKESATVTTQYRKLDGPNFTGQKIDLTQFKKPEKKKEARVDDKKVNKGKRRRISKEAPKPGTPATAGNNANRDNNRGPARKGRSNTPKE